MQVFYCEQRSPEWYNIKRGCLSASDFHIMEGDSEARSRRILDMVIESLNEEPIERPSIDSADIRRGREEEDLVIALYEIEKGVEVQRVGFIKHNDGFLGCSPDGLVGENGMVEIKCPSLEIFLSMCSKDETLHPQKIIGKAYYYQLQVNLFVSGREWIDFEAYHKKMIPFEIRVYPDLEMFEKIKQIKERALKDFLTMKEKYIQYKI